MTEEAVREFQRLFGLKVDGLVGPITLCALAKECCCDCPDIPPPFPQWTVVLDAGHGGADPGAAANGHLEKNDNLYFAMAVEKKLKAYGQNVIMTRTSDVLIPLLERSRISNRNNADIFVSFHRNYSELPHGNGVEVYVMLKTSPKNIAYAQTVFEELLVTNVQSNGGVRQANFSVLRETVAPAMLFELGYTTNTIDNQLFNGNIDAYATAISRGIMNALSGPGVPTHETYVVQPSNSLWLLAQRFGTTVDELIRLNKLTSDVIYDEQILKIPG
jgi:N-acetylmuramoyl-L-alanine amidase